MCDLRNSRDVVIGEETMGFLSLPAPARSDFLPGELLCFPRTTKRTERAAKNPSRVREKGAFGRNWGQKEGKKPNHFGQDGGSSLARGCHRPCPSSPKSQLRRVRLFNENNSWVL